MTWRGCRASISLLRTPSRLVARMAFPVEGLSEDSTRCQAALLIFQAPPLVKVEQVLGGKKTGSGSYPWSNDIKGRDKSTHTKKTLHARFGRITRSQKLWVEPDGNKRKGRKNKWVFYNWTVIAITTYTCCVSLLTRMKTLVVFDDLTRHKYILSPWELILKAYTKAS